MRKMSLRKMAVLTGCVGLFTTGCLSGGGDTSTSTGEADGPGKSEVEIMYGFGDQQEVAFQQDLEAFAAENDFTVKFTRAASWDTEIRARVAGGSPPDVGLFPQPGVMCDLAGRGALVEWDADTVSTIDETLVPGFVESGTCDDAVYGLPAAVSVKSLIWYDQAAWESTGIELPTTMDELLAATEQLASEGKTPWCIAAESGQATGWPITDWIEDLVLREAGPENYDKWVTGELGFASPEISPAFDYFEQIAFTDAHVLGGTQAIVSTNFQTGGNSLFDQPPGCFLFKQATFIAGAGGFPDDVLAELDSRVGVMAFPPKEEGNNPVLVGGDLAAAFNQDANTLKLRDFVASKDNGVEAGKAGYFSPHTTFDPSLYPSETIRTIATDVLYASSAARFDGSDLMPAEVGAGTFWSESVKWISGQVDKEEMLSNIDASWPEQ